MSFRSAFTALLIASRVRLLGAIRKKLPRAFARPDLEMVALDYFRKLGHDTTGAATSRVSAQCN